MRKLKWFLYKTYSIDTTRFIFASNRFRGAWVNLVTKHCLFGGTHIGIVNIPYEILMSNIL